MSTALTPALREQHEQDEAIIRENIRGAFAMAKAFKRIRESRSYLLTHATFEEYCRERWDMGRAYINLMIAGNEVVESLPPAVATVVANEAIARAVAKVEPSVRVEVVERAVEKAKERGSDRITARDVEEATHKRRPAVRFDMSRWQYSVRALLRMQLQAVPESQRPEAISFLHALLEQGATET